MKTLVLANHKGGVGKSAVATLLAQHVAQGGHRVLAIDLDHQGNFGRPLRLSGKVTTTAFTADEVMTAKPSVLPAAGFVLPPTPFVLVPAGPGLLWLERQREHYTAFARALRAFLTRASAAFDVCVIDTHPNPDIRLIAALASTDFVLSPIQLNQEALDGVAALLNHDRVGLRKFKAVLNPRLQFIGLLPTLVEPTPFQKANLVQVIECYGSLMIRLGYGPGHFARIPRRSVIAEAQASGELLWAMKKTAARDAWKEIEPCVSRIAEIVASAAGSEPGDAAAP